MSSKELIKKIILEGTPEEKRELFSFDKNTPHKIIRKKFKLFARGLYPRYFEAKSAGFHDDMIMYYIKSYHGINYLNVAFRGSAKTTLKKLFDVFVLLNDKDDYRKYIKVLTKDIKNSKQVVTDVYNLIVEVRYIYGNPFAKEGDVKREETTSSFTMSSGRKYASGTVGQTQRGHVQDAYRPDWVWFDDVEDRDSIRSSIITEGIIGRISEAIDGLSKNGNYVVTGNYISDQGTIQWFMNKSYIETQITPIMDEQKNPTWEYYSKEDIKRIREDADDFHGEFMCDPQNAENKFFDFDKLTKDIENAKEPIRTSAGIKYWAEYKPHHRYGQGSDHSEGIGQDSNTLALFDFTAGELIVTYANNEISPDMSAHEFARVGAEFGNCIYAPEINNNCGGTVITTLKHIGYPNIYKQVKEDEREAKQTEKLGWNTTSSTKYNMFYEFKKDYSDGLIKIHDVNVLREMRAYSNNDLKEKTVGLVTKHFDLLTAAVIGWQMKKYAGVGDVETLKFQFDKRGRATVI